MLHSVQTIHRDLKPKNILVKSEEPLQIVLADFDVATDLEGSQDF